jgi:hypothetical protein
MVCARQVLFSVLAAWAGTASAAPTQAVLGRVDVGAAVERVPTPATVQTSNTTFDTSERDETSVRVLTFNCWCVQSVFAGALC